jgi:hypothetical protein
MLNIAKTFHFAAVVVAVALSVWVALEILYRVPSPDQPVLFEHLSVGIVCATFAIAHLIRLSTRSVGTLPRLTFYPLFGLLGLFASLVARNSAKHWAPGSGPWAFWANVLSWGTLIGSLGFYVWLSIRRDPNPRGA